MTTIRALGHVIGLVAQDRLIRLDQKLGIYPMSAYWRGYADGQDAAAETQQELKAEAAELMADEIEATVVIERLTGASREADSYSAIKQALQDFLHNWAAEFREDVHQ